MAIVHGKAAWLGRMLDSGISPNTEVQMGYAKESGESLLDFAIESGQIGIAKELVERGAYANQPDNQGMLPLEAAALSGETDLVSFLLDHGADIDKPDISGRNALMGAIVGGSYQTAKLLLNHGASVGAALGKDLVLPPQLAHPRDAQYAAIRDLMVDHGAVMPQGGN